MKSAKIYVALGLLGLGALSGSAAMADDEGWYVGIGAGQSSAKFDYAGTIANARGGVAGTGITTQPRDKAYKIFGGYNLGNGFAFEGGYFNLGKFGVTSTNPVTGTFKASGVNLDFLTFIPFTERFSAFARIGAQYATTKDTFVGPTVVTPNPKQNEVGLKVGFGAQYDIVPAVKVRGEWERYIINDGFNGRSPINVYSLSLVFPFGSKPAPQPVAAAPAPAPAPAPVKIAQAPAPVAPTPAPEKLTLSAGSLFDFDKADVKPEGKQSLDKLANDLKSVNYDAISVTGHTDRIGTDEYNAKLSVRRAESVKKYLVDNDGIEATKIFTSGKGKTDPVTKPGECKGNKKTKKLVKCLQPDRRVVVEVSGTRK